MLVWLDRIGIILFDAAFATAVFSTLIVLAMLACRQPARRILLARISLLATLAIIPLVAWGHLPRLYVIDTFVESRFFPRALFLTAAAIDPAQPEPPADDEPDVFVGAGPGRLVPNRLQERVSAVRRWLPRGVAVVDLSFVAVGAAWMCLGIAGIHWLIHRSRPPSPATRALFDDLLAERPRSLARTGLRVCSRLQHPVVSGLWRPVILIPDALDSAERDPEPLRLSLLHELAHAEQSDHLFYTAASVAQSLWFFLPQIWWIRSQLLIDQEFLADRAAAECYGTSSEYASSLLSLASAEHAIRPESAGDITAPEVQPPAKLGVQSPLFQRMMMLLHCPYPVEARTPRVWSWTSRFAVVLASVAAACLVIRLPQASFAVPAPTTAGASRPRFQLPHLLTEPLRDVNGHMHSRVNRLPVTLPSRFDLEFDVRSDAVGIVQIRVVGQMIEVPGRTPDPDVSGSFPAIMVSTNPSEWHHVHLHRDRHRVTIEREGRPVPTSRKPSSTSEWLTIESPSSSPVEFRNLMVSW